MRPGVTVIALCVDDLERSVAFYAEGLGFKTAGIVGREFEFGAVAFFDLQPGLKLALWPRNNLAHDGILPGPGPTPMGSCLESAGAMMILLRNGHR